MISKKDRVLEMYLQQPEFSDFGVVLFKLTYGVNGNILDFGSRECGFETR